MNRQPEIAYQKCLNFQCGATFSIDEVHVGCPVCGDLLDIEYDWDRANVPDRLSGIVSTGFPALHPISRSGVWRFHKMLPYPTPDAIVSASEGQTILQQAHGLCPFVGMDSGNLFLQYEGMNPSGSFKDNGMTAAFTHACMVGAQRAACASTGNTSASLAMYCAVTGAMRAIIFVGSGKIAMGKLAQALDYGALTIQVAGDFDDAMKRVQEVSKELKIYLVNSVNPFRLEGQKTIMFRVLQSLDWEIPDWIVVPGGNLGNSSSFGKAFLELHKLGLIDRIPRLAIINANGARTLHELYDQRSLRWESGETSMGPATDYFQKMEQENLKASTIASAIEINRPVNLRKCLRALEVCDGVVREVDDQRILDAKAQVGANGMGCEPASAASVAGAKLLRQEGIIAPSDRVVCVLTGHQLKDPTATVAYHSTDQEKFNQVLGVRGVKTASYANRAIGVPNDLDEIIKTIKLYG